MKKLLLTLCCAFMSALSYAYDFEVDNLCYTILSTLDKTVSVQKGTAYMSGDVIIPSSVVYNGTSFTVTKIPDRGFAECRGIKTLTLPCSLTHIGYLGLGWCSFSTIILDNPGPTFSCGSYAFDYDWRGFTTVKIINCSVKDILEQGVGILNYLPVHELYINGEKITDFVVPNGTSAINTCFKNCNSIKSLSMPSTVQSITSSALYNCEALETIRLSSKIATIGYNAFMGCASLRTIYSSASTPPSIDSSTFPNGAYMFGKLYVPNNSASLYKSASGWNEFVNIEEVDNGGTPYQYFEIKVSVSDGGCVTLNGTVTDIASVKEGDDITLSFTPDNGYELKSVEVNGVDIFNEVVDNSYTINSVNHDITVNVKFKEKVISTDVSSLSYAIYSSETTSVAGKQMEVPVNLKNENTIATWQADLVLPTGFTIATDEYNDPKIAVSGSRTTSARHAISTSTLSSAAIRILYNSSSNKTISGTDGEVATITLNVADGVEAGDYPIIFKNIVMSEANETGHKVDQVVSKITVQSYTPGDVNNDGEINAQDLVAVVNYILENPTSGNIREAADLNNDGNIDAMDYVAEVNLILSDGAAPARAMAKINETENSVGEPVESTEVATGSLNLAPFCIVPGEEKEIVLSLDGLNDEYVCCQFDLALPMGISVVDAESVIGSHSVAYRTLDDGSTRLLLASPSNKAIRQSENGAIRLTIKADKSMMSGQYTLDAANIMFVKANAQSMNPASASFAFNVGDATGISNVNANADNDKGYNIAGQPVNASAKGLIIVNGKKTIVK